MANCNKCGALIAWRQGQGGGYFALNLDGTDHAEMCSRRVRESRQDWVNRYRKLEQQAERKRRSKK